MYKKAILMALMVPFMSPLGATGHLSPDQLKKFDAQVLSLAQDVAQKEKDDPNSKLQKERAELKKEYQNQCGAITDPQAKSACGATIFDKAFSNKGPYGSDALLLHVLFASYDECFFVGQDCTTQNTNLPALCMPTPLAGCKQGPLRCTTNFDVLYPNSSNPSSIAAYQLNMLALLAEKLKKSPDTYTPCIAPDQLTKVQKTLESLLSSGQTEISDDDIALAMNVIDMFENNTHPDGLYNPQGKCPSPLPTLTNRRDGCTKIAQKCTCGNTHCPGYCLLNKWDINSPSEGDTATIYCHCG